MVERRRVVVTGLGVVSSIGIGKDAFWKGLLEGRSGVSQVVRFDTSKFDVHLGGEVKDFRPGDFFDNERWEKLGRASQFAIAATRLAAEDAGLTPEDFAGSNTSVCLGTAMADIHLLEAMDDEIVQEGVSTGYYAGRKVLQYPGCMIATNIASEFRMRGRVAMIPTACAAGNYAIAYGSDLIRLGKCDVAIVGGVDPFSRIAFTGFSRIFAVAPDYCSPFDRNRKGTIVGEGAGILILESLIHSRKRNANPYAEVLGYGINCDAHHMTIPTNESIANVMRKALADANINLNEVDYISAHGTGTPANDKAECSAICEVFGEWVSRIPVSSIKSMIGHTMGAASALEAITCALATRYDEIPPTINHKSDDPECDIDCVPNASRAHKVRVALNNSFAFGGNNACVVFQKV